MKDIRRVVRLLITALQTYKLLILTGLFILPIYGPLDLGAQAPDPVTSIRELHKGYLIVRMPSFRSKIDTLEALVTRADDPTKRARFAKLLQEAKEERDTLLADYVRAFKNQYHFSKVAYFMDYDSRNLNTATYYNLDGERIAVADLSENPLYYLYFERTQESKIDALVVYSRMGKKIPKPFPNDFSRSGVNFLFLKISSKNFPAWRVGKMEKRFYNFWSEFRE
jgi:hypothetical protein